MGGGRSYKCPECKVYLYSLYIGYRENNKHRSHTIGRKICPQCEKIYNDEELKPERPEQRRRWNNNK